MRGLAGGPTEKQTGELRAGAGRRAQHSARERGPGELRTEILAAPGPCPVLMLHAWARRRMALLSSEGPDVYTTLFGRPRSSVYRRPRLPHPREGRRLYTEFRVRPNGVVSTLGSSHRPFGAGLRR